MEGLVNSASHFTQTSSIWNLCEELGEQEPVNGLEIMLTSVSRGNQAVNAGAVTGVTTTHTDSDFYFLLHSIGDVIR